MNKKALVQCVVGVLKSGNIRKSVSLPCQEFFVSDKYGNSEIFKIPGRCKDVAYTVEDIQNVINAVLCVIMESLKRGEEINIRGFGCLGLHYRAARRTKEPNSGTWCEVGARYVPKFRFGKELQQIALRYNGTDVADGQDEVNTADDTRDILVSVSEDAVRVTNIADEVSFEEFFFRITGERLDDTGGVNDD